MIAAVLELVEVDVGVDVGVGVQRRRKAPPLRGRALQDSYGRTGRLLAGYCGRSRRGDEG